MSSRFTDLRGGLGLGCILALDEAVDLAPQTLVRAVREIAPRSSVTIEERRAGRDETALAVELDGMGFAILIAPGPLSAETLAEASFANVFWPEGPDEIEGHRATAAVMATTRERGHGRVRAQAIMVTTLGAALAEVTPTLGVYWPGAEVLADPGRPFRAIRDIADGRWPVDLWIGYTFFGIDEPGEPLVVGVQSRGAVEFLGFELEVPPFEVERKSEPIRILLGAAGYLMNFGDVIRDGQLVEVLGEKRTQYELHLGDGSQTGLAQLRVLEPDRQPAQRTTRPG